MNDDEDDAVRKDLGEAVVFVRNKNAFGDSGGGGEN